MSLIDAAAKQLWCFACLSIPPNFPMTSQR